MVPGSHQHTSIIGVDDDLITDRGDNAPIAGILRQLGTSHLELAAGETVMLDPRILHASAENSSGQPRAALVGSYQRDRVALIDSGKPPEMPLCIWQDLASSERPTVAPDPRP